MEASAASNAVHRVTVIQEDNRPTRVTVDKVVATSAITTKTSFERREELVSSPLGGS